MMTLGLEAIGNVATAGPVPAFGRLGPWLEIGISDELRKEVRALAPQADLETTHRVADAVSLRGPELVGALLERFGDVDEALAALEDYAGAFDSLAEFAADVFEERYPYAPDLSVADAGAMGEAMIAGGEVFSLRLGADLHIFWRV